MSKDIALGFITFGGYYLHFSKLILNETIKNGNRHMISWTNSNTSADAKIQEYAEATKWSDFNIIIPTLFNFYHGVELLLKGILKIYNSETPKTHKIKDLFQQSCLILGNTEELQILQKYLTEESLIKPIRLLIKDNNLNSLDNLYEVLRYPTDKSGNNLYLYFAIKYKKQDWIPYMETMLKDINTILIWSVGEYRKFEYQKTTPRLIESDKQKVLKNHLKKQSEVVIHCNQLKKVIIICILRIYRYNILIFRYK